MTNDTKSLLESKTVWGAIIAIAGAVLNALGFDTGALGGLDDEIVTLIGGLLAVYGRATAIKKIK